MNTAYKLLYYNGKAEDILIQIVTVEPYSVIVFTRKH